MHSSATLAQNINNKLYITQPDIKEWQTGYRNIKKKEFLSRLRLGHTFIITHSYKQKKGNSPMCYTYDERYTMEHILIKFIDLRPIRENFYRANNMNESSTGLIQIK